MRERSGAAAILKKFASRVWPGPKGYNLESIQEGFEFDTPARCPMDEAPPAVASLSEVAGTSLRQLKIQFHQLEERANA